MNHRENAAVRSLMSAQPVSITPKESVLLAARLLAQHNLGALPVCDEAGHLLGLVTDRDIVLRAVAQDRDPARQPVEQIMSREVCAVRPDTPLSDAARLMSRRQVRRLPVTEEDGLLVGILTLADLLRRPAGEMEAAAALEGICRGVRKGSG